MKTLNDSSTISDKKCDMLRCRICLNDSTSLVSLFDSANGLSILERIMLCTRVQIQDGDGFPKSICSQCCTELDTADNFRIKCEFSDKYLREIIIDNSAQSEFEDYDSNLVFELKKESNSDTENKVDEECKKDDRFMSKKKRRKSKKLHTKKDTHTSNVILESHLNIKIENDGSINSNDNYLLTSRDVDIKLENITDETCTINHNFKKFVCDMCHKSLTTKASLLIHIEKVHGENRRQKVGKVTGFGVNRRYHCMFCEYSAKRRQILEGHIRSHHTGEKPFKCTDCNLHFSTSSGLCNHSKVHSEKTYFTCPECGKQFKMKSKYERHKNVHVGEKKYKCQLCGKSLKTKSTLSFHMDRHYNIKNYNCETCGATFVTASELICHSRSHRDVKKLHCEICKFTTDIKANLEVHMRRHSGDRPFKCDLCDWTAYTVGCLNVHKRKHTKEKKYTCDICHRSFIHSSSFNQHVFKSHGKKYKWNDIADRRIVK